MTKVLMTVRRWMKLSEPSGEIKTFLGSYDNTLFITRALEGKIQNVSEQFNVITDEQRYLDKIILLSYCLLMLLQEHERRDRPDFCKDRNTGDKPREFSQGATML